MGGPILTRLWETIGCTDLQWLATGFSGIDRMSYAYHTHDDLPQ